VTRAVRIRVDEVVLEGVTLRDGRPVADALTAELTRLVGEGGLGDQRRRGAERVVVESEGVVGPSANALGVQLARAVYGALQP
jgi:hypothetical protein